MALRVSLVAASIDTYSWVTGQSAAIFSGNCEREGGREGGREGRREDWCVHSVLSAAAGGEGDAGKCHAIRRKKRRGR